MVVDKWFVLISRSSKINYFSMNQLSSTPLLPITPPATDLAGSLPMFPGTPGDSFTSSLPLPDFRQKRLIFNRLNQPGQVHVYRVECRAGERLRLQLFVPVLPLGGSVAPSFAVVAKSLPYSADVRKLPLNLPGGLSAVVAPSPSDLVQPVQDVLTGVRYYPGPIIDTKALISGRCYVIVWSPQNHMGKYVLQTGHRWPLAWSYWAQIPRFWWQIRGWFGLSRMAGYLTMLGVLLLALLVATLGRKRLKG